MNDLLKHLELAHERLRSAHGDFRLFGLFLPEEANGRWDLIVAAAWLANDLDGYQLISDGIRRSLKKEELAVIGRIVIVDAHERSLEEFLVEFGSSSSTVLMNFDFAGVPISQAHVIYAASVPPRVRSRHRRGRMRAAS